MKKYSLLLLVFVASSFTTKNTGMTDAERKAMVDYLSSTKMDLHKAVKGLSPEQLSFKPSPDKWSVIECVEHIIKSEGFLLEWTMGSLKEPANPAKRAEVKVADEIIAKGVEDRSNKVKTYDNLVPKSAYASIDDALKAFDEVRKKTITYVETTPDDLRNHFVQHPYFGTIDSYQTLLLLAGHSKRHTLQIEEVKADPNFPKK